MRRERRMNKEKGTGERARGEQKKKKRKERHPDRTRDLGVRLLEQSGAVPAANRANSGRQMMTNAANLVAGGPTPSH